MTYEIQRLRTTARGGASATGAKGGVPRDLRDPRLAVLYRITEPFTYEHRRAIFMHVSSAIDHRMLRLPEDVRYDVVAEYARGNGLRED